MSLKKAVHDTLNYSAIFQFPLTAQEVYKYLITDIPQTFTSVYNKLEELVDDKKLKKVGEHYLPLLGDLKWAKERAYSYQVYPLVIEQVKKDLKPLFKIPFIQLIAITGSVGAKNIKKDFDIDLFFVCKNHTIWITRLLVVLFFKIKKVYRGVYCPNIYVSESHLAWDTKSIYVANEIARLTPIYNKNHTYEKFLYRNKWVLGYLPNLQKYFPQHNLQKKSTFWHFLLVPVEVLMFALQYLYMKRKITTERVSYKKMMFIKNDYTNQILSEFERLKPRDRD